MGVRKDIVDQLKIRLSNVPIYYAKADDKDYTLPCITYLKVNETTNSDYTKFDNVSAHTEVQYQINLFTKTVADIETKDALIKQALISDLQFRLNGYREIIDPNTNIIQCAYTFIRDNI